MLPVPLTSVMGQGKYFESNGFRIDGVEVQGMNRDAIVTGASIHDKSGIDKGGFELRFEAPGGLGVQGVQGRFDATLVFQLKAPSTKAVRFASVKSNGNGIGEGFAGINARLEDTTDPISHQEPKLLSNVFSGISRDEEYDAEAFTDGIQSMKALVQIKLESFDSGASAFINSVALKFGVTSAGDVGGDYDLDEDVDGADFLVWQRELGFSVDNYAASDGNGNGIVDGGDYVVWRNNFGAIGASSNAILMVPEPGTIGYACFGIPLLYGFVRQPGHYVGKKPHY